MDRNRSNVATLGLFCQDLLTSISQINNTTIKLDQGLLFWVGEVSPSALLPFGQYAAYPLMLAHSLLG